MNFQRVMMTPMHLVVFFKLREALQCVSDLVQTKSDHGESKCLFIYICMYVCICIHLCYTRFTLSEREQVVFWCLKVSIRSSSCLSFFIPFLFFYFSCFSKVISLLWGCQKGFPLFVCVCVCGEREIRCCSVILWGGGGPVILTMLQ